MEAKGPGDLYRRAIWQADLLISIAGHAWNTIKVCQQTIGDNVVRLKQVTHGGVMAQDVGERFIHLVLHGQSRAVVESRVLGAVHFKELEALHAKPLVEEAAHTTRAEKLAASQQRDVTQSQLLAGFLNKLKSTKEADGSRLFDNVALVYGSNIRTGHELSNCPTILTGGAAGIKLGENIVVPKDTPLCNAWLTLLHGVGVEAERLGDSTGPLNQIIA
jgi:hypothetical protein